MSSSSAASDAEILDKVLLRLAVAEDTATFSAILGSFLAPALKLLVSPDPALKSKVVKLVSHVNTRLGSNGGPLPLTALVDQYLDPTVSPVVKNLTLVYINKALSDPAVPHAHTLPIVVPRLAAVLADLDAAAVPSQHANSLLHILAPHLAVIPPDTVVGSGPGAVPRRAVNTLLDFALDMLLLRPQELMARNEAAAAAAASSGSAPSGLAEPSPGLSHLRAKRVLSLKPPTTAHLAATKAALAAFVVWAGAETGPHAVLPHILVGLDSESDAVRSIAERGLRNVIPTPMVVDDLGCVTQLAGLVAGDPQTRARPVSMDNAMRIMPYLTASPVMLDAPNVLDVLKASLFSPQARMVAAGKSLFHALFRTDDTAKLEPLAEQILRMLLPNIGGSGLGSFGYVAVGRCSRITPHLVGPDLRVLDSFFVAAETGSADDRSAVKEALTDLMGAFQALAPNTALALQDVLAKYASSDSVQARLMTLFYTMQLFPFDNLRARVLCIRMTADANTAVATEAARGLRPYSNIGAGIVPDASVPFPPFDDAVTSIVDALGGDALLDSIAYLPAALEFLVAAWESSASPQLTDATAPLVALIVDILGDRVPDKAKPLRTAATLVLAKMIPAWSAPDSPAAALVSIDTVLPLVAFSDIQVREAAAQIVGALAAQDTASADTVILGQLAAIIEAPDKASSEAQHGALLAAAAAAAAIVRASSPPAHTDGTTHVVGLAVAIVSVPTSRVSPLIGRAACKLIGRLGALLPLPMDGEEARASVVAALMGLVPDSVSKLSIAASADAAGASAGAGSKDADEPSSAGASMMSSSTAALSGLWTRAVMTVGQICAGEPGAAFEGDVIDLCFKLGRARGVSLQFAVADALASVVLSVDVEHLEEGVSGTRGERDAGVITELLRRILVHGVADGHSFLRQAACVWLVRVCQAALEVGAGDPIVDVLAAHVVDIQSAFEYCLTDKDTLTQEVASMGLSLTYQLSESAGTKRDLLAGLVKTLSSGAGNATTKMAVQSGEPLFEASALGLTPDGGSVSTYKEICSVATDVGQPELIYKFMGLARSNALWTSRAGSALGFAAIAKDSPEANAELAAMFPTLVPKLFRYRFDPDGRVQSSMTRIWKSLVDVQVTLMPGVVANSAGSTAGAERALVSDHFAAILSDVLKGMGSRSWRVREGSALALGALLDTSPPLARVESRLQDMWNMGFRSLDDIKESVRMAGLKACSSLGSTTLKFCSPEATDADSTAGAALGIVMPFLLDKGLVSDAKPVQMFALGMIVKIVKQAKGLLKPHLPHVVGTLLRAMSSLEPQEFNYLTLNQDKYNLTTEQVEGARLAMAKSSPISRTLEAAVASADAEAMQALVPEIAGVITRGVGLPTKVGAAKLVIDLVESLAGDVTPYCKRLMKALMRAIHDPSPGVRSANAAALGYLSRHAKTKTLARTLGELVDAYMGAAPGSPVHGTVGLVLANISRTAPTRLASFGTDVLPMCMLAMHASDEATAGLFRRVWQDTTSGDTGGVRLYAEELVAGMVSALKADQWPLRQQAAAALSFMASSAPAALAGVSIGADGVLGALCDSLKGRLWSGKESVVAAMLDVAILLAKADDSAYTNGPRVMSLALEQTAKGKPAYRYAVIKEVVKGARFYGATAPHSVQAEVYGLVKSGLEERAFTSFGDANAGTSSAGSSSSSSSSSAAAAAAATNDRKLAKPLFLATQAEAVKALGVAFPSAAEAHDAAQALNMLQALATAAPLNPWNVRTAIFATLATMVTRSASWIGEHPAALAAVAGVYTAGLDDLQYKGVREAALDAIRALLDVADAQGSEAGRASILAPGEKNLIDALRRRESTDREPSVSVLAKKLRRRWQQVDQ